MLRILTAAATFAVLTATTNPSRADRPLDAGRARRTAPRRSAPRFMSVTAAAIAVAVPGSRVFFGGVGGLEFETPAWAGVSILTLAEFGGGARSGHAANVIGSSQLGFRWKVSRMDAIDTTAVLEASFGPEADGGRLRLSELGPGVRVGYVRFVNGNLFLTTGLGFAYGHMTHRTATEERNGPRIQWSLGVGAHAFSF